MSERFLTKSLFVRALTCPRKLYYVNKPDYADNSLDDDFLESLAEGGIQVGALARCYFPEGIIVDELDKKVAVVRTKELLKRDRVTVFEAAIQHGSCFFRADILVKDGNCLDLIEVKAKSYDQGTSEGFVGKRKDAGLTSGWKPYLYDVAFQKHVLQQAFPKAIVRAHLMLADKRASASVDGLNQRFILQEENGRTKVVLSGDCSPAGLGVRILVQVPVDDVLAPIMHDKQEYTAGRTLVDCVSWLSENYRSDRKIDWPVGVQCKDCEFKASPEQRQKGLRSGFCECWGEQWNLTEDELAQPTVFDIWNFRRKAELLEDKRLFLRDVTQADILGDMEPKSTKPGLSRTDRQWMQVRKAQTSDLSAFFDRSGLEAERATWRYPLHFIDFETSAVAIPFNSGRHPYEGVAFQFSHHVAHDDGRIEHIGQYLNATPGVFPSYDFLRALKRELERDEGTIFRYAAHENTYLNMIHGQLQEEAPGTAPDRDELCRWIETVTTSTKKGARAWQGGRTMVDMCELVKRYYYDPYTQGSNSIKWVLPAVLNSSPDLQAKYSKAIYGASNGIPSLNYRDWIWIQRCADGSLVDPYKLLPAVVSGLTDEQMAWAEDAEHLADGAAAMMAYARLQFTHVPDDERLKLEKALLRYCELDTFAMVLIWEHWMSLL